MSKIRLPLCSIRLCNERTTLRVIGQNVLMKTAFKP